VSVKFFAAFSAFALSIVAGMCAAEDIPIGQSGDWKFTLADSPVGMVTKMPDGTLSAVVKANGVGVEAGGFAVHPVKVDCRNNRIKFGTNADWQNPVPGTVTAATYRMVCNRQNR
jgi:hypothetical protein